MITKNAMQLKALIKKKAVESNVSAQYVMQNYMMERLLERISLSPYRNNFILKGGFLISAIIGLEKRTTMDLDTTIKGLDLSHGNIRQMFSEICKLQLEDDITFKILGTLDIREADDYPGIRLSLNASYPPVNVPLKVDITTGDIITPQEVDYSYSLIFDNRRINILAYSIETILAEKIETVLSRSIANTRPRDLYDIYVLHHLRRDQYRRDVLRQALKNTANKRGSQNIISLYPEIIQDILTSEKMWGFWQRYKKDYSYATSLSFNDVCSTINEIMESLGWEDPGLER